MFLWSGLFFLCKYNHIDKHLHDKMMKWIAFGEIRSSRLLCFEEAFNEEKVTYDKINVCELRGKCFAMFFFWFFCFAFLIHLFILYVSFCWRKKCWFWSWWGWCDVWWNGWCCDAFPTPFIDSNVSIRWEQRKNKELGHVPWLTTL
jgi:hypothetical protein